MARDPGPERWRRPASFEGWAAARSSRWCGRPAPTRTRRRRNDPRASGSAALALSFVDTLPAGVVVATPSNATTDCVGASLTAAPGTALINLIVPAAALGAGETCTADVDVTAADTDLYVNVSDNLLVGPDEIPSGFAIAELDVPKAFLIKSFTDDPVVPGGMVTLEFTVNNPSRDFPVPRGIVFARVDPETGMLAGAGSEKAYLQAFAEGTEPTQTAKQATRSGEGGRLLRLTPHHSE